MSDVWRRTEYAMDGVTFPEDGVVLTESGDQLKNQISSALLRKAG
jgi:hypothetical protein